MSVPNLPPTRRGSKELTARTVALPAINITGAGGWQDALAKARSFVAQLTLEELVNMTTGADVLQRCVGETGSVPRLGQRALCLEDSPVGVRFADYASTFPSASVHSPLLPISVSS